MTKWSVPPQAIPGYTLFKNSNIYGTYSVHEAVYTKSHQFSCSCNVLVQAVDKRSVCGDAGIFIVPKRKVQVLLCESVTTPRTWLEKNSPVGTESQRP